MERDIRCIREVEQIVEDRFRSLPFEEPHDIAHFMYQISPLERLIVELDARKKVQNMDKVSDALNECLDDPVLGKDGWRVKKYPHANSTESARIITTDKTLQKITQVMRGQLQYYGYFRDSREEIAGES